MKYLEIPGNEITHPFLYATIYLNSSFEQSCRLANDLAGELGAAKQAGGSGFDNFIEEWVSINSEEDFLSLRLFVVDRIRTNEQVRTTYLLQINRVFNTGDVKSGWESFHHTLVEKVAPFLLKMSDQDFHDYGRLVGYMLIYGAEKTPAHTQPGDDMEFALSPGESSVIKSLSGESSQQGLSQIVVSANTGENNPDANDTVVTLVKIPEGTGLEACSLYWAIVQPNAVENFNNRLYDAEYGALTEIDLLMHKALHQTNDFESTRNKTEPVIDLLIRQNFELHRERAETKGHKSGIDLGMFSVNFEHVISVIPLVEVITNSQQVQLFNLTLAKPVIKHTKLFDLIRHLVATDLENNRLFLTKIKSVLETVQISLNYKKAIQHERESQQLGLIQRTIGYLGIFVSMLGIISQEEVRKLLPFEGDVYSRFLITTGVRLILAALITVPIGWILFKLLSIRKKKS